MQGIGSLINTRGLAPIEEVMNKILDDYEVQQFLSEYSDIIDDAMLRAGLSVLNEYRMNKNDPRYLPILFIYNGQIAIKYKIRDITLEQRFRDKVPASLVLDETTKKYKGLSLEAVDRNDMGIIQIMGVLEHFLNNYQYGSKLKGAWLYGKYGIGKSYLMGAFANELYRKNVGVTYVSSSQMMDDIYETMRSNSDSVERSIKRLMKAEVLIIDDLGTEKATDFTIKRVLYPILKYRGEYNKQTFVISNLTKDDYYIHLNNSGEFSRVDLGRLKEQVDVLMKEILMTGKNRRVKAC